ncbi:MAG: cell entry protein [Actinomycetia bacterium]|nr:cell entry protein [Actinomycetes bacterium]
MPTNRDRANKLRDTLFVRVRRATGGRFGTRMGKAPILLLTTTGRRSGRSHTRPLIHLVDGDSYIVVASNAGQDHAPAWFHNLMAEPAATVELGATTIPVRAEVVPADEAGELWPRLDALFRGYASYRRKTSREIPLVRLRPA